MFARSSSVSGDPARIDTAIAHMRDQVLPAVTAIDGCVGLSLMVDRETGRGIATTSWATEAAMAASREAVMSLRSAATEMLGGGDVLVEEWEVALMHREHPTHEGATCRVVWGQTSDIDASLARFRSVALARLDETPGFCSASMLVDRARGVTCTTSCFESREALDATRDMAAMMRDEASRDVGISFTEVAELDLAIAHLRVPELV